jgi:hypothetical protein
MGGTMPLRGLQYYQNWRGSTDEPNVHQKSITYHRHHSQQAIIIVSMPLITTTKRKAVVLQDLPAAGIPLRQSCSKYTESGGIGVFVLGAVSFRCQHLISTFGKYNLHKHLYNVNTSCLYTKSGGIGVFVLGAVSFRWRHLVEQVERVTDRQGKI